MRLRAWSQVCEFADPLQGEHLVHPCFPLLVVDPLVPVEVVVLDASAMVQAPRRQRLRREKSRMQRLKTSVRITVPPDHSVCRRTVAYSTPLRGKTNDRLYKMKTS